MMLPRLTLFGRSLVLMSTLFAANAVCWIVAGLLFGRNSDGSLLSLALLAWTLGLRHALDADHISAIDNATRGLINMGQLPVTCGLFFSLGHSTIVIVVNVAIAISTSIYDKLDGVGTVGGIVGAAVSGSFLFIVGLANSIILWRIIRKRQRAQRRAEQNLPPDDESDDPKENHTLMLRILGPVITFVNKPWKMYPVGVLFGFGFDTASSIALLAISALARKRSDGSAIPSGYIVILPLLFTAGMTIIDSADSVLMLYSYSGFPERTWAIIEVPPTLTDDAAHHLHPDTGESVDLHLSTDVARDQRVKTNVMSGLSIILTLMSIFVAFSISLITIMGLIGEQCARCQAAANAPDGGGLAGKWWRGWANANDKSGFIGAAIVGSFVVVVACWYGGRRLLSARRAR
ncbi:NicO-domain-containing protein [Mycena belliarum]|uniref:Nickel/cobalt efflux system n=1 Tax=Mycena belliarum TaxID=1033014 RepID=A0AAD6TSG6_9AGAR|nr:NicO-domain-containing protein [Mycena belliae]